MNKQIAYQTLVTNYLTHRKVPEEKQKGLAKRILNEINNMRGSSLTDGFRHFLLEKSIAKNAVTAYLDANSLSVISYKINKTQSENLSKRLCKFKLNKEERKDILDNWAMFKAENETEAGIYGNCLYVSNN